MAAAGGGCAGARPERTYLVAAEAPFWDAVTAAWPNLAAGLEDTALADGGRLQVLLVGGEQPRAELAEQLAGARYAGVVLTALLALEAEELAAAHPEVRFVLLPWSGPGRGSGAPLPANVTEISFERSAAYERAGRLVAAHLAERSDAAPVAVVAVDWRESAGLAAFRAGLAAGGAPAPIVKRFARARGSAGLRDRLDAVIGDGAAVVYLEVGELTAEALRALTDGGRLAVVGNWGRRPGFEATVLLSVDDAAREAIVAGIESPAGTRNAVPARVVWGLAAPLPDAAADLYDDLRAAPAEAGERSPTATDP